MRDWLPEELELGLMVLSLCFGVFGTVVSLVGLVMLQLDFIETTAVWEIYYFINWIFFFL